MDRLEQMKAVIDKGRGHFVAVPMNWEDVDWLINEVESLRKELAAIEAERTMYQECCGELEVEKEKLETELSSLKLFTADIIRDNNLNSPQKHEN